MSNPFSPEELQRVAANRAALVDAHTARETSIDIWLERLSDAEAVLMPLIVAGKRPVESRWQETSTIDWDEIDAHLRRGGNIGAHLGASRWVGWDGDNGAATAAMLAAGFDLFTISAGSRNPAYHHAEGAHVLWRLPSWVPRVRLTGPTKAVMLANGASIDVLAGNHQVVVPPSVVVIAEPTHYVGTYATASEARYCEPDRDGWLKVVASDDGVLPELPLWALSADLLAYAPEGTVVGEPPAGWEPMAGTVMVWREAEARVREPGEGDDELTTAVDQLDLLSMLEAAGIAGERAGFDSCGPCETWLRAGSDAEKSITVHDCDQHGSRVQVWTTAFENIPQGGHSRLDAFCGLTGRSRGDAMRELGLVQEKRLTAVDADDLEEAAAEFEAAAEAGGGTETVPVPSPDRGPKGEPVGRVIEVEVGADGLLRRAAAFRSAVAVMRAKRHLVPTQPAAVLIGADSVVGLPAGLATAPATGGVGSTAPESGSAGPIDVETVEQTDDSASVGSELDPDDAIEGELLDETDAAAEARKTLHELRPKIKEIERLLAQMTPGLKRVADCAESNGVFMHGFLGSLLPRIVASVPPNVLLPPRNGDLSSKVKGQGINQYGVQVAPSSAGKSETDNAAEAAIPLQHGVAQIGNGTSESWSKELRGKQDGKRYIKTTSLIVQIDEVADFNEQLLRTGSKMKGWLAASWMNGGGGQSTSDEKNSAHMPKHGSRIGISVNAQPGRMDVLAALADQGAQHRFSKTMAGLVRSTERGPLYGIPVPPVMADQSAMPWYSLGHVGEPPIACQQPQSARDAGGPAAAPPIVNKGAALDQGDGSEKLGVTGFDDADPIWFQLCETAKRDVAEALDVAADRAENWDTAFDQDQDGLVTGHRVAMKLHVSAALAVLDGTLHINEAMWEAAELFQVGSDLTAAACAAYMELSGEAEAYRQGHLKGVGQAAARAADATVTSRGVESSMRAIIRNLRKVGGSSMPGYVVGNLSKSQKAHAAQAAEALQRGGLLLVELNGRWTLTGQAAIAA